MACECGTEVSYAQCCRPLHRGEAHAEVPSRLVKARFCAFARRELDYLWRTLHSTHPDRSDSYDSFRRDVLATCTAVKFVRLHLIEEQGSQVLFLAEAYRKGQECSFLERSQFAREEGEWRYLKGEPRSAAVSELPRLTRERMNRL